ncbi:MAG: AAA family ATPase, partial [Clostridia bacterium]|nr:AAA family ATPase [Clostridia bacterium]
MGKIFAVTSGKGGVGKSTFSTCLAYSFAKGQQRTVLIDLDEGLRCLDIMLGADSKIVFDLGDAVGDMDISKALYKIDNEQNLFFIPAPDRKG